MKPDIKRIIRHLEDELLVFDEEMIFLREIVEKQAKEIASLNRIIADMSNGFIEVNEND